MLYRLTISSPQLRHVNMATSLYPVLLPSVQSLPSAPVFNWSGCLATGYNRLLVDPRWLAAYVRSASNDWLPVVFEFLSGVQVGRGPVFHLFTADQLEAFQEPVLFLGGLSGFTRQAQLVTWWFSYWTTQFCSGREPVFLFADIQFNRSAL